MFEANPISLDGSKLTPVGCEVENRIEVDSYGAVVTLV